MAILPIGLKIAARRNRRERDGGGKNDATRRYDDDSLERLVENGESRGEMSSSAESERDDLHPQFPLCRV